MVSVRAGAASPHPSLNRLPPPPSLGSGVPPQCHHVRLRDRHQIGPVACDRAQLHELGPAPELSVRIVCQVSTIDQSRNKPAGGAAGEAHALAESIIRMGSNTACSRRSKARSSVCVPVAFDGGASSAKFASSGIAGPCSGVSLAAPTRVYAMSLGQVCDGARRLPEHTQSATAGPRTSFPGSGDTLRYKPAPGLETYSARRAWPPPVRAPHGRRPRSSASRHIPAG